MRRKGAQSGPAPPVHRHESPMQTAVREVREETGLIVAARHMTGCYYLPENDSVHFVFRCDLVDVDAAPVADLREISECKFWPAHHLPRPISDWTVQRIQDAMGGNEFGLPTEMGPRVWLK